jgi:hypothetical protein
MATTTSTTARKPRRRGSRLAGLKGNEKAIATILGVGGAVIVGGIAVYEFFNPGPSGGSCTQPGTPCYAAVQPCVQAFNAAASQYSFYYDQFLKTDTAAGTGITGAQQSVLATLQASMDHWANCIATNAKPYTPPSIQGVLASYIGEGILVAATIGTLGYAASKIIPTLRAAQAPTTGSIGANAIENAYTQAAVETGEMTPSAVPGFQVTVTTSAQDDIVADTSAIQAYVADALIDPTIADTIIADDTVAINADTSITEALLLTI